MISSHLDPEDGSALDIGCASGYFTNQLTGFGLFTVGIDRDTPKGKARLEEAKQLYDGTPGTTFMAYTIDPETVKNLPSVDVTLLLTVYHHWVLQSGRESAEEMLLRLADKTDKLFFEPPGSVDDRDTYEKWPVAERPMREDEKPEEYYAAVLDGIFDDTVRIEYIGEAPYPHSDTRTDPLFVIECRDYQFRK